MPNLLIVRNSYPDLESVQRLLNYVLRTSFYGGYAIDPEYAFDQMRLVKEAYHKTEGVQLKHFLLTFSHEEMMHLDFKDLLELGFQVGKVLERYQIVYCIHLDSDYIHIRSSYPCFLDFLSFRTRAAANLVSPDEVLYL